MAEQIDEQLAFGLTRASILQALQDNWEASWLSLFGDENYQEPWGFIGVFNPARLDGISEQAKAPVVSTYPASGVFRSTVRSTGAPAYGFIKRSSDWVIDVRFHSPEIDPASNMTLEAAGVEGELVQAAGNMNATVIDIVRKQLGCDNLTTLPALVQENLYLTSAPGQYGVILSARTLWTFQQETKSPFKQTESES